MRSALLVLVLHAVTLSVLAGCSGKSSRMSFEEFKSKRRALMAKTTTIDCPTCEMTGKITCKGVQGCKGTGKIVCDTCKGTGKVTCEHCNGSGLAACGVCSGTGKAYGGSGMCSWCKGVGRAGCEVCSNIRSDDKDYRRDQKSPGTHPCRDCSNPAAGTTYSRGPIRVCDRCGGKGAWVCGDCKGTSKAVVISLPTLAEWTAEFGEPTKKQEIDHKTYYYYECAEGLIQIEVYILPSAKLLTKDPNLY